MICPLIPYPESECGSSLIRILGVNFGYGNFIERIMGPVIFPAPF
jgi:hypothetical protein